MRIGSPSFVPPPTASTARTETFDLRIRTAQGDVATLSLDQHMGHDAHSSYHDVESALRIEGNFNAQETQAVNQLLEQIHQIAQLFFAGDIKAASRDAMALSLENESLSAFSVNMHYTQMQTVSASYRDIAALPSESEGASNQWLRQLKNILTDTTHTNKELLQTGFRANDKA